MTTPARQDRIVDAIVATLTEHAQVRDVECQIRRVSNLDDVMYDKPLLGLTAGRAAVTSLDDEPSPQFVPCGLTKVGSGVLSPTLPVRMRRTADLREMLGVAVARTEVPSVILRLKYRTAGIARPFRPLSHVRTWRPSSLPSTFGATAFPQHVIRPALKVASAVDALNRDLSSRRPCLKVARVGTALLRRVRRVERFGADGTGFQHSQFYHVQCDKALVQDSVMAAAIAAFQVVHPPAGWGAV